MLNARNNYFFCLKKALAAIMIMNFEEIKHSGRKTKCRILKATLQSTELNSKPQFFVSWCCLKVLQIEMWLLKPI